MHVIQEAFEDEDEEEDTDQEDEEQAVVAIGDAVMAPFPTFSGKDQMYPGSVVDCTATAIAAKIKKKKVPIKAGWVCILFADGDMAFCDPTTIKRRPVKRMGEGFSPPTGTPKKRKKGD